MSYDEEQQKRSRVVVETPTARREVVHQETTRYPERQGFSTGMVAAVALAAIAATAIIILFLTNSGSDENTNVNIRTAAATQPTPVVQTPVIVQQPLTQPTPIIIEQPAAPPVIIQQQAPPTTTTAPATAPPPASSGTDDTSLQMKVETVFRDDPDISVSNIIATVLDGKATLTGEVKNSSLKQKAERLVRSIKGISSVENKVTVNPDMP